MIRVTIEIIPHGREELKNKIGEIVIGNTVDHENRPEYGNYVVSIRDLGRNIKKDIKIKDHKRSDGVWVLLKKILENI